MNVLVRNVAFLVLHSSKIIWPAAVVVLTISTLAYFVWNPPKVSTGNLDFNAFYCAARILSRHGDPYRYEPLHACERRNLHPKVPGAVVPAPLPPYGIAAFVPLSRLAYNRATFLWSLAIVGSSLAVVWAIIELTGSPMLLVAICVLPMTLLQTLNIGGLADIPIALVCGASVAIVRERYTAAAILLGFACIEPHVAMPAALALFIILPKMRARLAVVALFATAVSAAVGLELSREYLASVLPAHAMSEAGFSGQYSLTSLLYSVGLPAKAALTLGSLQYALFVGIGVCAAGPVARRLSNSALVLTPVAFAVAGGTFVHATEIAAALPLAMLLAARLRSLSSWAAVGLLAVPWELIFSAGSPPTSFSDVHAPPGALAEVAWKALFEQVLPSPPQAVWHVAVYLGLGLVYWNLFQLLRRPIER
ncbi:MAG: glycosyltransferase family 87 protein [Candidatus Tumulicola sp.]